MAADDTRFGARGRTGRDREGTVHGAASQATEKVQEQAQGMRAQARDRARTELDTRSTQVGEQVG